MGEPPPRPQSRRRRFQATCGSPAPTTFASWGGGGPEYHNADLDSLILAVDYVSMHTYPFHDTHYNPTFWKGGEFRPRIDVDGAMARAVAYSQNQYASVVKYVRRIDADKPVHIGETGWASVSDGFYGPEGSRAADEYKQALFYHGMREWTQSNGHQLLLLRSV